MKKTSIIFIFCTIMLLLAACSTAEQQTQIDTTEATGTIAEVGESSVLIKNLKEKNEKDNPPISVRFKIEYKYYDEAGNKIKLTDLHENDNVKVVLTKEFEILETSPAQIDSEYVQKIILLDN
ncbi:hypothetical protein JL732_11985 [Listeria welshimeri]|uniref:hypothetical protein n=1 Tax=Listeria welshimeri TaxID=1643 RepID=UPI0016232E2B|nr:hypothetical protein [Listeria welshimeri]MBC1411008.1 hypothetical protein [Listeria welshimeri]MBS9367619.1 hypothetical protein [Listeria welshimeri]